MSYHLLEIPEGYVTSLILLVAPYYDTKFIKILVKKLSPEKIRIVVDDGVRADDISQLVKAVNGTADVKIALGVAPGLVHLKGYYVEFVKADGRRRRKRHFLYGSANATDAAFDGRRNAELIADVDLSAGEDWELLNYLTNLVAAVENGSGNVPAATFGPLHYSSTLHLPSFRIKAPGSAPGFDAWLQRGLLAAKYREAQQFLTVNVLLNKHLPQGAISALFANRGLIAPGLRNVVRFRYMRDLEGADAVEAGAGDDRDVDGAAIPQWKSRYCVWTHFGDWLSDDCYHVHGDGMVSKNGGSRKAAIDELRASGEDENWTRERKAVFLIALKTVWSELEAKDRPSEYLKGGPDGIDLGYYDHSFCKKLLADYRLAQDIPCSGQNPKILGRDDTEVVRYLIAKDVPFSGHLLAQKGQDRGFEVAECRMTSIVSDVPVHQAP
jgi:hypothetical protein